MISQCWEKGKDEIIGLFIVAIFRLFSTHFPIIFHFIFIPFFVRLKLRMNKKMYFKWNPNLAFAKIE